MLIPAGWFEQWADATWADRSRRLEQTPPVVRAPNGRAAGLRAYWIGGKPQYDPADIRSDPARSRRVGRRPAERSGRSYFAKLTSAPYKRFVEIGEGTHSIIMEKNRMQFFRESHEFPERGDPRSMN